MLCNLGMTTAALTTIAATGALTTVAATAAKRGTNW
jgi:hypothetical protein